MQSHVHISPPGHQDTLSLPSCHGHNPMLNRPYQHLHPSITPKCKVIILILPITLYNDIMSICPYVTRHTQVVLVTCMLHYFIYTPYTRTLSLVKTISNSLQHCTNNYSSYSPSIRMYSPCSCSTTFLIHLRSIPTCFLPYTPLVSSSVYLYK